MFGMATPASGRSNFSAMGWPDSARLDPSEERPEVVHTGITCDVCGMSPIRGVRHRCSVCPDFDTCLACVDNPAPRKGHDPAIHLSLRILRTTPALQEMPQVANRAVLVHTGFRCAGCPPPVGSFATAAGILGFRYQCVQCQIDLCESCEARGVHDATHTRLKIYVPTAIVAAPSAPPRARPTRPSDFYGLAAAMLTTSSGRSNFGELTWTDSNQGLAYSEEQVSPDLAAALSSGCSPADAALVRECIVILFMVSSTLKYVNVTLTFEPHPRLLKVTEPRVVAMLRRENELRLSEAVQAELDGAAPLELEACYLKMQRQCAREAGFEDWRVFGVRVLRCAQVPECGPASFHFGRVEVCYRCIFFVPPFLFLFFAEVPFLAKSCRCSFLAPRQCGRYLSTFGITERMTAPCRLARPRPSTSCSSRRCRRRWAWPRTKAATRRRSERSRAAPTRCFLAPRPSTPTQTLQLRSA